MSAVEFTVDQSQFLSRFFGPGNQLKWDAYVSGAMAASSRDLLSPLIDDFRKGNVPVILPRVRDSVPNSVQWYAMANHSREANALREQLTAFIGPTYSDFGGQIATLDLTDPVESAIAEKYSPHVFRIGVLKHDDRDKVRNKIFQMRSLRDRHPDRTTQLPRPVGRLLRDLEMALAVRNESSAWQRLDDLRTRGRLSSQNLAFLKVRILSNFDRWNDILALPEKNSIVTIRRPAQVTHALVRAIYNVYMSGFEQTNDVDGCIQRFRELEPHFGTLFRARGESRDLTVLKAFLIRAVAATSIHPEAVRSIAEHYPIGDSGRAWVDALASYASSQVPKAAATALAQTAIDRARDACESSDFDTAFELLLDCDPSAVVVRQLLACSREIDSLDAARRSLEYIDRCSPNVRDAALSMRVFRQMWTDLTQQASAVVLQPSADDIPSNWITWMQRLNTLGAWPSAAEIARHGAQEWPINDFLGNPERTSTFASLLISARSADAEAILHIALPELLTHFLPDGKALKEFKSIYLNLAYILALDNSINADDLSALAILAESVLESAPSTSAQAGTNEFREIVETLETAWDQVVSPRHIDWALQVLDILIGFNVTAYAPIDGFLNRLVTAFRAWPRRTRQDQWDLFKQLAADLGQADLLTGLRHEEEDTSHTSTPSLRDCLLGKSIAIYTLTERIGHRVAEVLTDCFTDVKVHLLHDHASSDRLEQLARSVDIFIVNTWDAKHAATNAIQATRAKDAVTLFPRSKSAGAIIRELYDFLGKSAPLHSAH